MVYGYFKNLSRRTVPDKVLRDNAFDITKDTKYNGYQRCLASMVCKLVIYKSTPIFYR